MRTLALATTAGFAALMLGGVVTAVIAVAATTPAAFAYARLAGKGE
jgi:hypothetical protein